MKRDGQQIVLGALVAAILTIGAGVAGRATATTQTGPLAQMPFAKTMLACRDKALDVALSVALDAAGQIAARIEQL